MHSTILGFRPPADPAKAPAREFLEWHYGELFRG